MRMNRLRVWGAIALVVALSSTQFGCPGGPAVIFFKDATLEAAVRQELGLPLGFVTRLDVLQLHTLDIKNLGIDDLSGLEFCTNLIFLDASGNPISDITPLANLDNLLSLNLSGTDVFELSPLAGLVNLTSLSLCSTQVTDIQPLVTNAVNNGLGAGDFVNLSISSLSDQGKNVDVPFLQFAGVNVVDCS